MSLPPDHSTPSLRPVRPPLFTIAAVLVSVACSWWLLRELAPVLRPLLVAIILGYIVFPYHSRLRKRFTAPISLVLLASVTVGALVGIAFAVRLSVFELNKDLPRFQERIVNLSERVQELVREQVPDLVDPTGPPMGEQVAGLATQAAGPLLNAAAAGFVESCVVGLYLLFLLLEASNFPVRVRQAYAPERAEEILDLAGQVNSAIISYLRAKVKSSLILALPVGLILWMLGVKFALLWCVLTFLCNFVPYIGSVTAYVLPVSFAFLQLDLDWRPVAAAILLLGCQIASASLIEPMLLGKAVGLNPMVILASLAFWGLLWGIPGMLIAVPLTVVAVIVMNHFEFTRPVAKLMSAAR